MIQSSQKNQKQWIQAQASQNYLAVGHYHEITLKGRNRPKFERQLLNNLQRSLGEEFSVFHQHRRVMVTGPQDPSVAMSRVFGLANFALCQAVDPDLEAVKAEGIKCCQGLSGSFRVSAQRSDKSFPLKSADINREVGAAVLSANPNLKAQMKDFEHELSILVLPEAVLMFIDQQKGAGGLPVGSSEPAVLMMSGGIDSPVAGLRMMKRGCRLTAVHCHSAPYTSTASQDKVRRLCQVMAQYQGEIELHMIPLTPAQQEVVAFCDPGARLLLYRRFMLRLADKVAQEKNIQTLVTGEAVGQVASQTLPNMAEVSAASRLNILRPLCGYDKNEIVDLARAYQSYDISIEPHDDCCTYLMPRHPWTKAKPGSLDEQEALINVEALLEQCWHDRKVERIKP